MAYGAAHRSPRLDVTHDRHLFDGPAFELQAASQQAISGIRSWSRSVGHAAVEGCSPFVARHTGGAPAPSTKWPGPARPTLVGVDYAPSATRTGAVVRASHQAAVSARHGARSTCGPRAASSRTRNGGSRGSPACIPTSPAHPPRWPTSPSPHSMPSASCAWCSPVGRGCPRVAAGDSAVDARCARLAVILDASRNLLCQRGHADGAGVPGPHILGTLVARLGRHAGCDAGAHRWCIWNRRLPTPSSAWCASAPTMRCARCASPATRCSHRRCCSASRACRMARAGGGGGLGPGLHRCRRLGAGQPGAVPGRAAGDFRLAASPWRHRGSSSWRRWHRMW